MQASETARSRLRGKEGKNCWLPKWSCGYLNDHQEKNSFCTCGCRMVTLSGSAQAPLTPSLSSSQMYYNGVKARSSSKLPVYGHLEHNACFPCDLLPVKRYNLAISNVTSTDPAQLSQIADARWAYLKTNPTSSSYLRTIAPLNSRLRNYSLERRTLVRCSCSPAVTLRLSGSAVNTIIPQLLAKLKEERLGQSEFIFPASNLGCDPSNGEHFGLLTSPSTEPYLYVRLTLHEFHLVLSRHFEWYCGNPASHRVRPPPNAMDPTSDR